MKTKLGQKLQDKKFRDFYFAGCTQEELALQIIKFRKERGLTQQALAQLCGLCQPQISRIEQNFYSNWNIKTILRVSNALNLRMRITFDSADKAVEEYAARYN